RLLGCTVGDGIDAGNGNGLRLLAISSITSRFTDRSVSYTISVQWSSCRISTGTAANPSELVTQTADRPWMSVTALIDPPRNRCISFGSSLSSTDSRGP